jgi:hypothetical protein
MMAFVLAAAATAPWTIYEVRQLFRTVPAKAAARPKIAWQELVLLLLAIALLAGAAYVEAAMIIHR